MLFVGYICFRRWKRLSVRSNDDEAKARKVVLLMGDGLPRFAALIGQRSTVKE